MYECELEFGVLLFPSGGKVTWRTVFDFLLDDVGVLGLGPLLIESLLGEPFEEDCERRRW